MLVNATPFPAQDVPYVDKDGQEVVIGIVKATFEVLRTGKVVRAEAPSPVRLVDEPSDRYNNFAPPALLFAQGVAAATPVAVLGMHEQGLVRFELPEFRTKFIGIYENGQYELDGYVDTVLVEPNRRRSELVSRASFPLGRTNLLRELRIDLHR